MAGEFRQVKWLDISSDFRQMFSVGFIGWTWDAFDFFTVSLCVTEIAKEFGVKNSEVTWVRLLHIAHVVVGLALTSP